MTAHTITLQDMTDEQLSKAEKSAADYAYECQMSDYSWSSIQGATNHLKEVRAEVKRREEEKALAELQAHPGGVAGALKAAREEREQAEKIKKLGEALDKAYELFADAEQQLKLANKLFKSL